MKKFLSSKKAMALGVVAMLVVAAAAYAYFTQAGNGTGSATVGSSTQIALNGTITGTLYPDGAPAGVSVLVTNNGSGSQRVDSVHLASIDADADHPDCDTSVTGSNPAFSMSDIPVQSTLTKTGTAGDHTTVTGSLQMNDTQASQDSCQGAGLTLNFTSN
jgi:hypothetical protein